MKQIGMNMEMVKKRNRTSILNYINRMGPISRKDIAEALGLTPAAVTQICGEFMANGILVETGTVVEENRAGRKKILVDINYDHRYVFGINIDLAKTTIALTNLKGDIVKLREILTCKELAPEEFLRIIADNCMEMQKDAGISDKVIIGAGVGVPGLVDKEKGKSIHAYGIWENEVPVGDLMSSYLGIPVLVENAVIALAKAGSLFGIGKEFDCVLLVKWGPGVGCAIYIDGKIYEGQDGSAANLGHYIVDPHGTKCSCGRRGCLETKISYLAIAERLSEVFSSENTPKMYRILKGDFSNFSRERLYEIIDDMDDKVEEILEELMEMFSGVIVDCMTLLAPHRVVLCGTVFRNKIMREKLIAHATSLDKQYDETKIVHTMLSDKEDYIGPVALVVGKYVYGYGDVK